jgi:hypothetical protein
METNKMEKLRNLILSLALDMDEKKEKNINEEENVIKMYQM